MQYLCFLPPILTLILALISKNIFVSLFVGIVVSSIFANGLGFIPPILENYMVDGISGNLSIFILLSIFGMIMTTIKKCGGFVAFSNFAKKHIKSPRAAKFVTWLLAAVIADGSISTVGVGSIMRQVNDEKKIPHEKIGLILSSTGTATGALFPWTIYLLAFSGMITAFSPSVDGVAAYLSSIKFQFYSFGSILMAMLVALEVLPDIGYMKKCEARARETGQLVAPGSEIATANFETDLLKDVQGNDICDIWTFILPFIVAIPLLIVSYFRTGMVVVTTPFLCGLIVLYLYGLVRRYFKVNQLPALMIEGFISYAPILLLLALAFTFSKSVSALGMASVAAELFSGLSVKILPFILFIFCAVISYASGSLLTASTMLLPIALALATLPGASMSLMLAACIGGASFGDSTSILSDIVVQSATGAGVDVVELGKAQLPMKAIMAAVVAVLFLAVGFVA